MKFFKHILILLAAGFCLQAGAQDLHFSQFFNSPLTTNPANTGFMPDGNYRLGFNYRDQWSSIMASPYKTMSVFGDVQLMRDRFENGWMGVGGAVLRDVAGSGQLTSTKVFGSVAWHQLLGYSSLLSLGFNGGYASKQINPQNLKFPDQFDGKFFDNKIPTSVVLQNTNVGYLDLQVGMNYAYFPTNNIYLNAGFSAQHVNRPNESFFAPTGQDDTKVPVRYTAFVNGSFKLNEEFIVNPNAYYSQQASVQEIVGGANVHYNLSGDGEYLLIGGLYYRWQEAFIPMVGLGFKDYTVSFTYDATVSSLRNFNNARGAFELGLVKQGLFDTFRGDRRQVLCPTFRQ